MFEVNFIQDENKIIVKYTKTKPIQVNISIADIDTGLGIYYLSNRILENGSQVWVIPSYTINFFELESFGGFSIKIYDDKKNLIWLQDFRIREIDPKINIKFISDIRIKSWFTYHEIFIDELFDIVDFKESGIVIDVGANCGVFTAYALYRGAGKVYSIEPMHNGYESVKQTFKLFSNVIPFNKALSNINGEKEIFVPTNDNTMISSFMKEQVEIFKSVNFKKIAVQAITFPTFIDLYNIEKIDVLKMDVEGAEYEIFEKIDFNILEMIDSIILEFHHNKNNILKDKIISKLDNFNFYICADGTKNRCLDYDVDGNLVNTSYSNEYNIGTLIAERKAR